MLPVQFKIVGDGAILPQYQTPGAAAVDLHAYMPEGPAVLAPGAVLKVRTGIQFWIGNPGYAMVVLPRSGLGRQGIVLANTVGLVDSDYQGELVVMLLNRSAGPFVVSHEDRIAQAMFVPVAQAAFLQVTDFSRRTERGEGGFGSTGGAALIHPQKELAS